MKKTVIMILTAASAITAISACQVTASAADSVNVTFSIETIDCNTEAEIKVRQSLTVTDTDGDGKLTPEDVMYLAHEKFYPGGVAAGLDADYIWGVNSCFSCEITDKNGTCVYTSSGPFHTRYTVEEGDCISWTPQFIMNGDYYSITPYDAANHVPDTLLNIAPFTVHASCMAQFKKDAATITAEGLKIYVDGMDTNVRTDRNGNATIIIEAPGYHRIAAYKPGSETELCCYDILVHENAPYELATVKIYTAEGIVLENALDFYDMDKDGIFTAYDAIYTALQRNSAGGEQEFKSGRICGNFDLVVQVNDYEPKPLGKANQLCANRNDVIVVRPAAQTAAGSYAAAAEEQTETLPAVTTDSIQTTETSLSTTEAEQTTISITDTTAAATTKAAASSTAKTGNVKTGDTAPVAMFLAGLAASAAAAVCMKKRRVQ